MKKIGILRGREGKFPAAFLDRINGKAMGEIRAEAVMLGGTRLDRPVDYAVIVDRSCQEIRYYRSFLKRAVLDGTIVINNPFWASTDDRFFGFCLAARLGIAVPRVVALPSKDYPPCVVSESLRNLVYPLNWQEIADSVGFPALLRPVAVCSSPDDYQMVHSVDDLLRGYDRSGQSCQMLQQFIPCQHYVRCFCVGRDNIIPVKYDPAARQYHVDHQHLSVELGARVIHDARLINEALGYDVNAIDFAVSGETPYAVELTNIVPDFDPDTITPFYFEQIVELMADMAIDYALHGKPASREMRWGRFLNGRTTRD